MTTEEREPSAPALEGSVLEDDQAESWFENAPGPDAPLASLTPGKVYRVMVTGIEETQTQYGSAIRLTTKDQDGEEKALLFGGAASYRQAKAYGIKLGWFMDPPALPMEVLIGINKARSAKKKGQSYNDLRIEPIG